MTILQALDGYYKRLAERDATPPFGYSREKISYALVLSPEGEVADLHCLLETSGKKPLPKLLAVPQAVKRTSGIKSNFLWDKTSYVLGVSRRVGERVAQEHADFRATHETALADAKDEGLVALRGFIFQWTPEQFEALRLFSPDMLDTNLVFRLDGERGYIHERPAARDLVASRKTATADQSGFCLVSGDTAPIVRLHTPIKGVQGAQTSGAALVSFNLEAFESFGKSQGNNAPVSERAAFGYGTALNALLERDSRNRLRIGDATTVFWAEADGVGEDAARAAEDTFAMMADPPPTHEQEARKVADVLENIATGRPIEECVPEVRPETRFYVLGLAPNAARLSVRFWHRDDIGRLAKRIGQHWHDLRIEPQPWKTPPAVWRLLYETASQRKAENIPPLLSGALMRAILTGNSYPRSLLATIVMRMRANHEVTGLQAALCKACLARDFRLAHEASLDFKKEDVPVALNRDEPNPAYRLGRLFAVLEDTQRAGLGKVNTTIRDRYFGAASAAPGTAFPMLIRNAKNHLKAIRGVRGQGSANWFEKEIGSILDGLADTAFPRSLSLNDQGRFAIGYYQQRESLYRGRRDDTSAVLRDTDLDDREGEV